MAWTTPKTNWASGDFFTYVDWNRIGGNIDYLYDAIGITPLYNISTNATYSSYKEYDDFNEVQADVFHLYEMIVGSDYQTIPNKTINSSPWSSTELNIIESLLLECKQKVEPGFYIYAGTELYADDNVLI